MKHSIILLLALVCLGLVAQEKESKTQPKEVVLGKDSQSDKYGEVPFNHENHSIKKYSPDGQSVLTCVECHHTDQPAGEFEGATEDFRARSGVDDGIACRSGCEAGEELPRVPPSGG